ncbi:hypothetical protein L7F22_001118 [Adiantum nelumboides]|nr:hypothetical protein [Adiantum nelumboides]
MEQEQEQGPSTRVVGMKELVDAGLHAVPSLYLRPPHERPASSLINSSSQPLLQYRIPIIDISALCSDSGSTSARAQVIEEIGHACEEWGFFQVMNHGVELATIQQLEEAAFKFFDQPAPERMHFYTENLRLPVMYRTSVNSTRETVRDWRDALGFNRYPGICDGFQEAPELCK